jgi:hypothetical protein
MGNREVCPANESAPLVSKPNLDLRSGQTGFDEEDAQAGFHWRLGGRFGELDHAPETRDVAHAAAGQYAFAGTRRSPDASERGLQLQRRST